MRIVILGLSITSSWGNGHATTYRGLVRELVKQRHSVLFLERDVPWYRENRDLSDMPGVEIGLYESLDDLRSRYESAVTQADAVVVGSYVPDGCEVIEWVLNEASGAVAFYDIDTPVTVAALERGDCAYLSAGLVPGFDVYLSFSGGPILRRLEDQFGAHRARAFYCSFDPESYYPEPQPARWDLGYLGTYSLDRQFKLEPLLLAPARETGKRFVVAGPLYPQDILWPPNVERIEHLPPQEHRAFYNRQRFTLNITRDDMVRAGHSPSVRLFEAAACGVPIISDWWPGLDTLFTPGKEILIAETTAEVLRYLDEVGDEERQRIGLAARRRVMACHTAAHRARELVTHLLEARTRSAEYAR